MPIEADGGGIWGRGAFPTPVAKFCLRQRQPWCFSNLPEERTTDTRIFESIPSFPTMSLSKIKHIVLVRIPNCPRNPAINVS